jgi:hypothetical protein
VVTQESMWLQEALYAFVTKGDFVTRILWRISGERDHAVVDTLILSAARNPLLLGRQRKAGIPRRRLLGMTLAHLGGWRFRLRKKVVVMTAGWQSLFCRDLVTGTLLPEGG